MTGADDSVLLRYQRQTAFRELGCGGQRRLLESGVLIVGMGGLGSWAAELLARAGVGLLRVVDDDKVELTNIHRQSLYDEADAAAGRQKVVVAAERLKKINSAVVVEPVVARLDADNVQTLARGVHLILDGTDNFATRFLINDYAVKARLPWVFAGVVRGEGQVMTIIPGRTACLRCIYDSPPPAELELRAGNAGVLPTAVAAIASIQAGEALKILAGRSDAVSPHLLRLDLWYNRVQRIDASAAREDCPCCGKGCFEFLEPGRRS
jgi:adenylyltransferase/sulfurtransferase